MPLRYAATSLPRAGADRVGGRTTGRATVVRGRPPSVTERTTVMGAQPAELAEDLSQAGPRQRRDAPRVPAAADVASVPMSSGRAHPRTGRPSYVVVELKQWSAARLWEGDVGPRRGRRHAWRSEAAPGRPGPRVLEYIGDFARALDGDEDAVAGAAYLHNATNREAAPNSSNYLPTCRPLFTGADRPRAGLPLTRLDPAPDRAPPPGICSSVARRAVAAAARGRSRRDRRRASSSAAGQSALAVDLVLHEVERARAGRHKSVVDRRRRPGERKERHRIVAAR